MPTIAAVPASTWRRRVAGCRASAAQHLILMVLLLTWGASAF